MTTLSWRQIMLRAQAVYTDPAECERRHIPPKLASSYLRATITEKNKREVGK